MNRKVKIITFTSFILIIVAFFVCIAVINNGQKKGDINRDGTVDITDLVIVNLAALGKETYSYDYYYSDMNDYGFIDHIYFEIIINIIL